MRPTTLPAIRPPFRRSKTNMLIFFEKKLVFLATPKTGSTAIEAALEPLASLAVQRPPALKHADLDHYNAFIAPWLKAATGEDFTTVALMREPLDWLRSWYRFRLRDDDEDPVHEMEGISFEAFANGYLADPAPRPRTGTGTDIGTIHADIGSQSQFLCNGERRVDRVFRYEDIEAFTDFMEERLDCALILPRLNVPPSVDVSLSPEAEARLKEVMSRDIALYNAL